MADASVPSATPTSVFDPLNSGSDKAQQTQGISLSTFFASLAGGVAIFGIEFLLFLLIKGKLSRIYQPRTYLVPEKERTKAPPSGLFRWLVPVFQTSNSDFIQKCGLDAYFFLRYLRTLLKIFIPLALVILPILLPLNAVHGRGSHFVTGIFSNSTAYSDVSGLDQLAWGNIHPKKNHRYWGHLILAVFVIMYTCFVFFDELRGYIRLRQAYLTSPQHRLRASATTVLVTAIPRKWCTFEALNGLYDVFPGGIRNIWINRDFDELSEKVKRRDKLARALEGAETSLIRNAKKAHLKRQKKATEKSENRIAKEDVLRQQKLAEDRGTAMADTGGISAGNPHQVRHTIDEALDLSSSEASRDQSPVGNHKKPLVPIPVFGEGLEAVGHGLGTIGRTVFGGLKKVGKDVDEQMDPTRGFVADSPQPDSAEANQAATPAHVAVSARRDQNGAIDASAHADNVHLYPPGQQHQPRYSRGNSEDTVYPRNSRDLDGARDEVRMVQAGIELRDNPQQLGKAKGSKSKRNFWKPNQSTPFGIPSPRPHGYEDDEFPLNKPSPRLPGENPPATINAQESQTEPKASKASSKKLHIPGIGSNIEKTDGETRREDYPLAFNEGYDPNSGQPAWKRYLEEKDRETMRLPIFGWEWMPSLPLIGAKVDTINYCRKEVARLNVEIEEDQKDPEKFPLMNSAFIQFNHQVAAHMACQAVSHHTPNQMAPRVVEISPDDVLWDNMSIKWWETYIRTGLVIAVICALVIGWAIPVTFTGLLSQINYLTQNYTWLAWLGRAPKWVLSIIQGILPQALLAGLLALLPIILRLLARTQGDHTGMSVELSVQVYYFAFLFVQVFLVVSISSGITTVIKKISDSPSNIPSILATNLPKATNYFFSYLLLQALSVSAGALVQVGGLFKWFILAPILDSTARQKWIRQTQLPDMQWGTFFPVYTNLACIGLIYSVISPLILVFNIITFSLFWLVYRYNTLYVTKFRFDTGGLLYPTAINQLFTGLYVMELCLVGLFFLVRDADDAGNAVGTPCKGQAIIMIICLAFTVIYQYLLNKAFAPLFRYLPITLEDEAVIRDEEFAKAQEKHWMLDENEHEGGNINDLLEERRRRSEEESRRAEEIEMRQIEARRSRGRLDPRNLSKVVPGTISNLVPEKGSWAERSREERARERRQSHQRHRHSRGPPDVEAQKTGSDRIGEALFSGLNDEIEDLTPEERDRLVRRAFQHQALRAKRPVIWIPRDELGVSDDEVLRTQQLSKHIWVSNEYTGLDGKGRVVYRRSPPDFSEVDLIEL